MAAHSGVLAWRIPWTGEPGGLQSMGSQRVGLDLATKQQQCAMQLTRVLPAFLFNPYADALTQMRKQA